MGGAGRLKAARGNASKFLAETPPIGAFPACLPTVGRRVSLTGKLRFAPTTQDEVRKTDTTGVLDKNGE